MDGVVVCIGNHVPAGGLFGFSEVGWDPSWEGAGAGMTEGSRSFDWLKLRLAGAMCLRMQERMELAAVNSLTANIW
jgi:hypothetical protein